jgi:poly-gamma-glutamate synthesis protein (capsule biosynthesis protein)
MKDSGYFVITLTIIITVIFGALVFSISFDTGSAALNTSPIHLVFVGDVQLSWHVGEMIVQESPRFPFEWVKNTLGRGDITMGNLESPVSSLNTTCLCCLKQNTCFRASPDVVDGLVFSGFDIMNVANNHALDYGPEVMNDTLKHLSSAGILYTGANQGKDSIQNPVIIDVRGTKVAYLGFTDIILPDEITDEYPQPWIASENAVKQSVEQVRNKTDIIVVTFHFGKQYSFYHSERQEQLAHAAADAGADIIIGHHPHVVQDMEIYNGSIIAYSLGNFIDDMKKPVGVKEGTIIIVDVDPSSKKIQGYSIINVTINDKCQPMIIKKIGTFVPL